MKEHFEKLVLDGYAALVAKDVVPAGLEGRLKIETTRNKEHGDFSASAAMVLAKDAGMKPRDLAQAFLDVMPASDELIERLEIAGPGFINVFLKQGAQQQTITHILEQGEQYGLGSSGQGQKIHIEYVSANPTGPLHVGHGRGAAYGASLASLT